MFKTEKADWTFIVPATCCFIGLKVKGYVGAIIAAIAIGVVTGLINWLLGLLGLA